MFAVCCVLSGLCYWLRCFEYVACLCSTLFVVAWCCVLLVAICVLDDACRLIMFVCRLLCVVFLICCFVV